MVMAFVNKAFALEIFPESLKSANASPIHKKDDPFDKKNYRPVSILSVVSEVYERVI